MAWWAYFAERERGFTEAEVGLAVLLAFAFGAPAYYLCGRAMDRFGRRPVALAYLAASMFSAMVLFQVHDRLVGLLALIGAVAFGLGGQPALSAFSTELFPTDVRGQAAAWVRNVFEVPGYLLGPAAIGVLGDHDHGLIGNIGDSVTLMTAFAIPALWLIWRRLPETRDVELDALDQTTPPA